MPARPLSAVLGTQEELSNIRHHGRRCHGCGRPGVGGEAAVPGVDCYGLMACVCVRSTVFLMGPMKQLKRMVEPTRLIATIMVLVSPPCSWAFCSGASFS